MSDLLPRRTAVFLFGIVVVTWGLNWAVTKILVDSVSPLWATAIRSAIAAVTLFLLLSARGQFIVPRRGDLPVVLAVGLLHMAIFSTLVAFGLQLVPVGRSIVLGYTTSLWVAPGARLFLGERLTPSRLLGIGVGMAGLAVMFNPVAFDWSDGQALLGNGLVLLAALSWAVSILYVRVHTWISTPFQLVFWQALLATCVLSVLALLVDGVPQIRGTPSLAAAFLYSGVCGTALGYWAMVTVNRSLPATTTSLGILATPVVGVASSAIAFGEVINGGLLLAMAMILGGIAIGMIPAAEIRRRPWLRKRLTE